MNAFLIRIKLDSKNINLDLRRQFKFKIETRSLIDQQGATTQSYHVRMSQIFPATRDS